MPWQSVQLPNPTRPARSHSSQQYLPPQYIRPHTSWHITTKGAASQGTQQRPGTQQCAGSFGIQQSQPQGTASGTSPRLLGDGIRRKEGRKEGRYRKGKVLLGLHPKSVLGADTASRGREGQSIIPGPVGSKDRTKSRNRQQDVVKSPKYH